MGVVQNNNPFNITVDNLNATGYQQWYNSGYWRWFYHNITNCPEELLTLLFLYTILKSW